MHNQARYLKMGRFVCFTLHKNKVLWDQHPNNNTRNTEAKSHTKMQQGDTNIISKKSVQYKKQTKREREREREREPSYL